MTRNMRNRIFLFGLVVAVSSTMAAQPWEFGGEFGLGISHDPTVSGPTASAASGFPVKAAASVVFGENPYHYIGGEFRYMFRWGGPHLTSNGTQGSMNGYANVLTYDILIHLTSKESRLRPYVAGGAGIKIYTGSSQRTSSQQLTDIALMIPGTQIEPAISAGAGVKYLIAPGVLLRLDFRTHMTPLPNDLIRPVGKAMIRGWTYDFVPMVGVSYVF